MIELSTPNPTDTSSEGQCVGYNRVTHLVHISMEWSLWMESVPPACPLRCPLGTRVTPITALESRNEAELPVAQCDSLTYQYHFSPPLSLSAAAE